MPLVKLRNRKKYAPLRRGDIVVVDDPDFTDVYQHSFIGKVVAVGATVVMVEDQEGNVFDVDRGKVYKERGL